MFASCTVARRCGPQCIDVIDGQFDAVAVVVVSAPSLGVEGKRKLRVAKDELLSSDPCADLHYFRSTVCRFFGFEDSVVADPCVLFSVFGAWGAGGTCPLPPPLFLLIAPTQQPQQGAKGPTHAFSAEIPTRSICCSIHRH